jgi:glucose-6-phosphate 1-dehydrogenase
MDFAVTCTGLAKGTPPTPCVVVIFGVAGDLASCTLIPSLYALGCQGLLPEPFAIIGFARRDWDDQVFRQNMVEHAKQQGGFRADAWERFAERLYYVQGDLTAPVSEGYRALHEKLSKVRTDRHLPGNILFHFSTPPTLYGEIGRKLAAASLLTNDDGWRRIIIEKPFGYDEASARALDRQLLEVVEEKQLFRVDHYLGKETVQNMLVFRFANPSFEPIWNRHYIDHVQITAAECEGIGTRAGYYDGTGVVRDMIQNHLLQLMCITAMEPPVSYDGRSLRNETIKVLDAMRPLDVTRDCVLGQYDTGELAGRRVPAYRDEKGVPHDSRTPTFAALKAEIGNWRWAGVPFYLRSGKRMPRKLTQISIHFKPTPHLMFPLEAPQHLQYNILTFRLQPDEGIIHTFVAKQPGPDICLRPVTMNFCYDSAFGVEEPPSAYEWLLLDAMQGDQTLFPRSDWIYEAWSIVDPIIKQWEAQPPADLLSYAAGSWGPAAADELLRRHGRTWQVLE